MEPLAHNRHSTPGKPADRRTKYHYAIERPTDALDTESYCLNQPFRSEVHAEGPNNQQLIRHPRSRGYAESYCTGSGYLDKYPVGIIYVADTNVQYTASATFDNGTGIDNHTVTYTVSAQ